MHNHHHQQRGERQKEIENYEPCPFHEAPKQFTVNINVKYRIFVNIITLLGISFICRLFAKKIIKFHL